MMFRFPYAIQYYLQHKGWAFAEHKAIAYATQPVSRQEIQWFLQYCYKLPQRWEENY